MRLVLLFSISVAAGYAQLTADQRTDDFRNLADLYARRYAATQWKQTALGYDLMNLKPWLGRVSAASNDLDFYDLMVEYVSNLQDAHDQYEVPSDFEAYLGFRVDLYDGKALIDSINRSILPADQFPFAAGDQLVSIDAQPALDLVKRFSKYVTGGNPRTVQRLAAELLTDRFQAEYPYAPQIGDTASVVLLSQSGETATYTIPWQKSGTALTVLGPSPGLNSLARRARPSQARAQQPFYQKMLQQLRDYTIPGRINVVGFDRLQPVFNLPGSFVQRLGKKTYDSYYTGVYTAPDGTRIGYLRIPDFLYPSLTDLDKEIRFFQTSTDVLVVDVMRNPGGDACSAEEILARLTTTAFTGLSAEIRVDWTDIMTVNAALADAQNNGADDDTIAQLTLFQTEFPKAFLHNSGRTAALPICASTASRDAAANGYSKPVLLLVDEMSASAADIFASFVQDNKVGQLFGYRTMGAGGSPEQDYAGIYSEGSTYVTRSLAVRPQPVVTSDYPTSSYIENVGVRPETVLDYMTADNLVNHGASFVDAFTAAAVKLAHAGQ